MTPQPQPVLFSGVANKPFARKLAKELGSSLGNAEIVTFSDSETHVIIHEEIEGKDVCIVAATSAPANHHIMELLLLVHAIRDLKPRRITAVIPFFGYRRQEKKTHAGESLTFQLIAKLLKAAGVSRVLVMDLHKHRSRRFFKEVGIACTELRAFEVIVNYFKKKKLDNFVVLAPDKGGIPESERYAQALNVPLVKVYKHRSRRDQVVIDRFEGDVRGKNVLIIDDEINTAGTLMGVIDLLKKEKARNIYFACTHPVLSGPAIERLEKSRIRQVVVTDTITLPAKKRIQKIHVLSVVPLFAEVIRTWSKKR
jgi:ribose-phosphate pyrophosphokinase